MGNSLFLQATAAKLWSASLREFDIWRDLSKLSSALAYLHSRPTTPPVLASDLSPHTVIKVYETEEKKAKIVRWKLLLLGSNTEHSVLDQSEVFSPLYLVN